MYIYRNYILNIYINYVYIPKLYIKHCMPFSVRQFPICFSTVKLSNELQNSRISYF